MTIEEIKKLVKQPKYDFLKTNEHLENNICLLTPRYSDIHFIQSYKIQRRYNAWQLLMK